jgi:hypothetical protein
MAHQYRSTDASGWIYRGIRALEHERLWRPAGRRGLRIALGSTAKQSAQRLEVSCTVAEITDRSIQHRKTDGAAGL